MMPEVIINNQESKSLNLSIFVSINGISFFTYNPVNFKASRIYRSTFSRPQKVENLHSLIYDEFKIHNIFNMRINKVVCCYENNLASFVPKSLFEEESLSEYLNKNIDLKENDFISYDVIARADWINVYVPFVNVNNMLLDHFGSFSYFHSTSIWIDFINYHSKADSETIWGVYKQEQNTHIVLLKNKKLQFYNCFKSDSENDLSYYVLMIASEFKIDSNTIPLYIIGEIVYQDNYYNELYKFVRSINFLRPLTRLNFESKPMNIHKDFCLINAIECV
jgi:hypothetical protein